MALPTPSQEKIIQDILDERCAQQKKHGKEADAHPPELWLVILAEEFGEVSKAVLNHDVNNYREELIQVAAVAMAAVENLDRDIRGRHERNV